MPIQGDCMGMILTIEDLDRENLDFSILLEKRFQAAER